MGIGFLVLPNERAKKLAYTAQGAGDENSSFVVAQLGASIFAVIITLVVFAVALAGLHSLKESGKWFLCIGLRGLGLISDLINLAYPTNIRLIWLMFLIIVHLFEIFIFSRMVYMVKQNLRQRRAYEGIDAPLIREEQLGGDGQFSDAMEMRRKILDIKRLDEWLSLTNMRKRYYKQLIEGRKIMMWTGIILLVTVFLNWGDEMRILFNSRSVFYKESTLEEFHKREHTQDLFPDGSHSFSDPGSFKALIVIIDGLRKDYMDGLNPDLKNWKDSIAADSRYMKVESQVPTMSVPNWLSIMLGTPPEIHGVMGNLLVPETKLDHIFNQAKIFNITRGVTASPWMGQIIESTLAPLEGDGTIPTSYESETESADRADRYRGQTAVKGITEGYGFMLVHFSNVDIQGHAFGVSKEYNTDDTYMTSATNTTESLEAIVDAVDSNTVVFFMSDHGQVDRGGHGGISPKNFECPLIVYKKGSNMGNVYPNPPGPDMLKAGKFYQNTDVAPTACAMMGIPVPRETVGVYIKEAISVLPADVRLQRYKDLFNQKKLMVREFLEETTAGQLENPLFEAASTCTSETDCATKVNKLLDIYYDERSKAAVSWMLRNLVVGFVAGGGIFAIISFFWHRTTGGDVVALFKKSENKNLRKANIKACLFALVTTVAMYVFGIAVFLILYKIYGYAYWDSTMLHYPSAVTVYAMFTVVPTIILEGIFVRCYHVMYTKAKAKTLSSRLSWIFFQHTNVTNEEALYLTEYWRVLFVWLSEIALLVLFGFFTFPIPGFFRVTFIEPRFWAFRFRVLTVMLISFPIFFNTLFELLTMGDFKAHDSAYDVLFSFRIFKKQRIYSGALLKRIKRDLDLFSRAKEFAGIKTARHIFSPPTEEAMPMGAQKKDAVALMKL